MNKAMKIPFLFFLLAASMLAHSGEPPPIDPQAYFGSYVFADGVRVTGGRFDEGGRQGLLYMDTWTVSRGINLKPSGSGFVPAFAAGNVDHVDFNDDASIMRWHQATGEVLEAKRTMRPSFLPATFANGKVQLEGTLYLPPGVVQPVPAIVLAHGSGPTTRYGGPWITFFLEQGMAVLAYDKRGTGGSGGDWKTSSYRALAGDLSAAVEWLKHQPQVDARRIGLHTSSQSGWYGPHTACMNDDVSFLIQRVGPAVDIGIGTAHENREEWRADGIPESAIQPATGFWLELHRLAARHASLEDANALLGKARQASWFAATYGEWTAIDAGWWQRHVENMQLEPARDAAALDIPILWFLADKDENVPYAASLHALEEAQAKNAKLKVATVHESPHSFLIRDENGIHYTTEYWSTMASWLHGIGMVE